MTKWAFLFLTFSLLLSCTPTVSRAPLIVDLPLETPHALRSCSAAPATPPVPRTIEQIGEYAHALAAAHEDCARTLRRLNRWLSDKMVTAHAPIE